MTDPLKNHTENGQFQTDSASNSQPTPASHLPAASVNPSDPQTGPEQCEKHTENGQFCADSVPDQHRPFGPLPDFRKLEWALYQQLLDTASAAAEEVRKHPNRVTLTQMIKLYELAFALGRRAVGMPLDVSAPKPKSRPFEPPFSRTHADMMADLERIYGSEAQDESQPAKMFSEDEPTIQSC